MKIKSATQSKEVVDPVAWFSYDNDKIWAPGGVYEGGFSDEGEYRPGKRKQFMDNIKESAKHLGDNCFSARSYHNHQVGIDKAYDETQPIHIVAPGPSLMPDVLEKINKAAADNECLMLINAATQVVDCEYDFVVWTERTADVARVWQKLHPKARIFTSLYANPVSMTFSPKNTRYLFNAGTADGVAKAAREAWEAHLKTRDNYNTPMLELPSVYETTQAALMIAYYMGFKKFILWGTDYCWYERDRYYCLPDTWAPDPEECYNTMIETGVEGVNRETVMTGNRHFWDEKKKYWTTQLLALKAFRLRSDIHFYRGAGVEVMNMATGGALKI